MGTEKGKSNAAIVFFGAEPSRMANSARGVGSQEPISRELPLSVPRVTQVFLSDLAPLKSTPRMVVSEATVCPLALC